MSQFSIAQLWVYPVKSLGGMRVRAVEITEAGSFRFDREWIVTTPDGKMLWQGDLPRMTLISARVEGTSLRLTDRDGATMVVYPPIAAPNQIVQQYGFELPGTDAGDEAAIWLSERLGRACRLVHVGPAAHRWGGLNPVHVVSLNSLAALNAELIKNGDAAVEVERFRPNVVLGGSHEAYAEEVAPEIRFAGGTLGLREPCVRCILPNIMRSDATRGKQPLKLIGALSRQRPSAKSASFGTYCKVAGNQLRAGGVGEVRGTP